MSTSLQKLTCDPKVLSDGYRNPDAWRATKDIFQPVIPPLVFTIVVPFLIVAGLRPLKIVDWVQDEQAARESGPRLTRTPLRSLN